MRMQQIDLKPQLTRLLKNTRDRNVKVMEVEFAMRRSIMLTCPYQPALANRPDLAMRQPYWKCNWIVVDFVKFRRFYTYTSELVQRYQKGARLILWNRCQRVCGKLFAEEVSVWKLVVDEQWNLRCGHLIHQTISHNNISDVAIHTDEKHWVWFVQVLIEHYTDRRLQGYNGDAHHR